MEKIAETKYPVQEVIRRRWSARSFDSAPISNAIAEQLIEAASWASSSMNEQPWLYIYAHRESENFKKFVEALLPGNQVWAQHAAVLMISLVKTHFDNGNVNRHAMHDVGAANQNLMLEATSEGIVGHLLGGFDMTKTKELFEIPQGYEPAVFIALGYPGDVTSLPEPFQSRETAPRKRKPLNEVGIKM